MYVEDNGKKNRPNLWKKEAVPENTHEMVQLPPGTIPGENRPIIVIINNDRGDKKKEQKTRYRARGGFFNQLLSIFYIVKGIIKIILIGTVIILVIILVTNPHIITQLFEELLRKIGLHNGLMQLKRMMR